jgi:hypothetical protein
VSLELIAIAGRILKERGYISVQHEGPVPDPTWQWMDISRTPAPYVKLVQKPYSKKEVQMQIYVGAKLNEQTFEWLYATCDPNMKNENDLRTYIFDKAIIQAEEITKDKIKKRA